ncbi:MAG: HNH endonuclease signature motif containing protein [Gammaproteobacteria bacterium]
MPAAIHRALWARDRGCRFPGCGRTRFVEAHHVVHWARGGETSLDNLPWKSISVTFPRRCRMAPLTLPRRCRIALPRRRAAVHPWKRPAKLPR